MSKELRTNLGLAISVRSADEDQPAIIEGYAAMYGERTVIWGCFEEEIVDGFFEPAIRDKHDCRALFNHDPNYPLGRTKSGTLSLRSDEKGLWTETRASDSPIACSIVDSIRRGDVDGMSFAFTIKRQEWLFAPEGSNQMDLRRLLEIERLYDVGPVTYPAYEQTSVKVREEAKKLHNEARSRWMERNKKILVASAGIPEQARELVAVRANAPLCECRSSEDADWQPIEGEAKIDVTEESPIAPDVTEETPVVEQEEVSEEAPIEESPLPEADGPEEDQGTGEAEVLSRDPASVLRALEVDRARLRFSE